MQQFNGRPSARDQRENGNRRQLVSLENNQMGERERRMSGEPAKYNTRTEQRRISWENDLYERQSI